MAKSVSEMMQPAMQALLVLLFTGEVFAAVMTAAPEWNAKAERAALQFRQATTATYLTVLGYYSNGEDTSSGTTETIWAPTSYSDEPYGYVGTIDDYFNSCPISYSYTLVSSDTTSSYYSTSFYTPSSSCTIYTQCSGGSMYGTLDGSSTSYFCQSGQLRCFTYTLFSKFGDTTGALTSFACSPTVSGQPTTTVLYRELPASTGLTSLTSGATPATSPSPLPTLASPTPTPTETGGGGGGGGGGSKNAGVIAGSVVGGLAVLAIAGVAIFWILKRNKRHAAASNQTPAQPPYASPHPIPYYPPSQSDKPLGNNAMYDEQRMSEVPEYVPPPAHSGYPSAWGAGNGIDPYGRTSPPQGVPQTHSPIPMYPEGFRGELSGVRSPAP